MVNSTQSTPTAKDTLPLAQNGSFATPTDKEHPLEPTSAQAQATVGATNQPGNSESTVKLSPPRRFDPFLPLDDHVSISPFPRGPFQPQAQQHLPPPQFRMTRLPPAAPVTPEQTPYPAQSASLVRDHRPKSLYLPLEEKPSSDGGGNSPTWPFVPSEDGGALLNAPPSAVPEPYSPSFINPIYAEPPTPLPPPPPLFPTPSPPVVGLANSLAQRLSLSPSPVNGQTSRKQHQLGGETSPNRHQNSHSVGTHSLLASRSSALTSTSFAARMDTPTAWLILYFGFNLGLTLFNKLVLQGFPFPWTLTGIQMLSGTIGTQIALDRGFFVQARLTTRETGILVAFSVLYTVNIAVSNLSLQLVTVPFHQVIRAMTPLFTIILSAILLRKRHSRSTYLSLVPVVIGVCFATYGDYYFTAWGFILTLIGTFLAAVKTIVTNRIQVGRLKLHPLDLLIRMSPLAFMQCVLWAWYSGEMDRVRVYGATEMTRSKAVALLVNGVIAFGLNVVSFTANKKTSALTMTVAANVKQVLTIILAVIIFNLSLSLTNLFGITLTLAGGAWYAKVELQEKSTRNNAQALSNARLTPNDLKLPGLVGGEKH